MKFIRSLSALTILLVGMAIVGCEKESPNAIDSAASAEDLAFDGLLKGSDAGSDGYDGNAGSYDGVSMLWAGKTSDAGTVTISNDADNYYVEYNTNGTGDLKGVHVYVWTDAGQIPTKRPAPGRAQFKVDNLYTDSYTVTIPRFDYPGEVVYISAHAALVTDAAGDDGADDGASTNGGEGAYAGGANYPNGFPNGKGAWWGYVTYTAQTTGGETFTISGTVVAPSTCSGQVVVTLSPTGQAVFTDSNSGTYSFTDLPAGEYTIEAALIPTSLDAVTQVYGPFTLSANYVKDFSFECPAEPPPPPPPPFP